MPKIRDILGGVLDFTGSKNTMNYDELDLVNGYQNGKYTVLDISTPRDLKKERLRQMAFCLSYFPEQFNLFMGFETANNILVFFVKLPKNDSTSKRIQNQWRLSKHTIRVDEID